MAGDWIKMRGCLATHPRVLRIAAIIGDSADVGKHLSTGFKGRLESIVTRNVTRDVTVASLLRVWCAANEHTDDGIWHGMSPEDLDQIADVPGFGLAMEAVGWAIRDDKKDTTSFPNFLEYNAPAKNGRRSKAAERQRRYRAKQRGESNVTGDVTHNVTGDDREEKRREEKRPKKKNPQTPLLGEFSEPFLRFWAAWPPGQRKQAKPKSWEHWQRDSLDGNADHVIAVVEFLKTTEDWQRGKMPMAQTWLNQQRWKCDLADLAPEKKPPRETADEKAKRIDAMPDD